LSSGAGRLLTVGLLVVVVGLAIVALRQPAPANDPVDVQGIPAGTQEAIVDTIVDGDTIWIRPADDRGPLPQGDRHKIRLLEIDTPETQVPGAGVECGGHEATDFAAEQMPVGSTVHLLPDREDVDRYGRFLRYVWTDDGDFFNLDAVRTGHARAVLYEPNDAYIGPLRAAESQARALGLGVWGEYCGAEP
jgi:micrococcal nuclease